MANSVKEVINSIKKDQDINELDSISYQIDDDDNYEAVFSNVKSKNKNNQKDEYFSKYYSIH